MGDLSLQLQKAHPRAIPAPSPPHKPLDRSLENKAGETSVYIRGLLPETAEAIKLCRLLFFVRHLVLGVCKNRPGTLGVGTFGSYELWGSTLPSFVSASLHFFLCFCFVSMFVGI